MSYQTSIADLIEFLIMYMHKIEVKLFKVKSHQDLCNVTSIEEARQIIGNDLADKAAGAAVRRIPHELQHTVDKVGEHSENDTTLLTKALKTIWLTSVVHG